jgi:hypothetical protein
MIDKDWQSFRMDIHPRQWMHQDCQSYEHKTLKWKPDHDYQ